eukprot:8574204-Alexandrium_andersonii.AAC.1
MHFRLFLHVCWTALGGSGHRAQVWKSSFRCASHTRTQCSSGLLGLRSLRTQKWHGTWLSACVSSGRTFRWCCRMTWQTIRRALALRCGRRFARARTN